MKKAKVAPSYYKPEEQHTETFLVVDVDGDVEAAGPQFRAYMTGRDGGEDSGFALSAEAELPEYARTWCEENVLVDREECFAIAPEVLAHEAPLPAGYTGGGIAIQVCVEPPRRVLRVLKARALACSDRIKVLGFRIVTRVATDTSVAV
jgi:hypothetical protein